MSQKRGNNGEKFKRKIFLVKIGARKKGFLKPKSGQKWQNQAKKTKTLRYEWIFGDRESLIPKKISKKISFSKPKQAKNEVFEQKKKFNCQGNYSKI